MKKKLLTIMLSAMTIFSTVGLNTIPAMANTNELVDSTASSKDDENVGEDTSQGVTTQYETLSKIKSTTYSATESTTIYATKSSYVIVTIPRVLILGQVSDDDDSTYVSTFNVKIKGDISGAQSVTVSPKLSNTLAEVNGKNSSTNGTVSINDSDSLTIEANDLLNGNVYTATGKITINNVTAGQWSGGIDFDISVNND